jgi:spectinomycin phosphotransferase
MRKPVRSAIESAYGFTIVGCEPGPRKVVAETYLLDTSDGARYFAKLVNKPTFVPQIRASLPVAAAMHRAGLDQISYPIKATTGYAIEVDGTLVTLLNYIDGAQTYDYPPGAFGRLLGRVHGVTLPVPVPAEEFDFLRTTAIARDVDAALAGGGDLAHLLKRYERDIRTCLDRFAELAAAGAAARTSERVLTHGDAPGNVMVDAAGDLYLIDWDEILLAPAERDLWMTDRIPEFMAGYRAVRTDYQPAPRMRSYYVLWYYFRCLRYYLTELAGEPAGAALVSMENDFLAGWMMPEIRAATAG